MKSFFSIIILFFYSNFAQGRLAQEWLYKDNGQQRETFSCRDGILVDSAGNIYTTGYEETKKSMFVQKRDPSGFLLWNVNYNDEINYGWQRPMQMRFDKHENLLISVTNIDSVKSSMILKYDQSGNLIWAKNYGNLYEYQYPDAFETDSKGNIYIGIYCQGSSTVAYLFIKTDEEGKELFEKTITSPQPYSVYHISIDSNFNIIIPYSGYDTQSNYVSYLYKIDSSGNTLFSVKLPDEQAYYEPATDKYNNIILASTSNNGSGLIIKLDPNGNILWNMPGAGCLYSNIIADSAGNTYAVGAQSDYMVVQKVDPSGNVQWTYIYSSPKHTFEYGERIMMAADGSILASGIKTLSSNEDYAYVITLNLNEEGILLASNVSLIAPAGQIQNNSFCVDRYKNVYHAGDVESGFNYPYVFKLCNKCLANITGNIYEDGNLNCSLDQDDIQISNRILFLTPSNTYATSDINGNYSFVCDSGIYTIKQLLPKYWTSSCNIDSANVNTLITNSSDTLNFGSEMVPDIKDLQISYGMTSRAGPGFKQEHTVFYKNVGTTIINNPFINLHIDTSVFNLISAAIPPDTSAGNSFSWNLSSLNPQQSGFIYFETMIASSCPLGKPYQNYVTISPFMGDYFQKDNSDTVSGTVVEYFDPNEKSVTTTYGNTLNPLSPGENELSYQIDFQNTGNDTALMVRIVGTLDSNLDISTIRFGAASKNFTWSITGKGLLVITFKNINLPESNINVLASMGFVKYYIKPKAKLADSTVISNTAYIYFDFNSPINTNTVYYPSKNNTSVVALNDEKKLFIFPNPSTGKLSVLYNLNTQTNVKFILYNLLGQRIQEFDLGEKSAGNYNFTLDLTNSLTNNIYFLQTIFNGNSFVNRVVLMK